MEIQIDSFADVVAALSDIEEQCTEACDNETNPRNHDIKHLWMSASLAINKAVRDIEDAQRKFMGTIKVPE